MSLYFTTRNDPLFVCSSKPCQKFDNGAISPLVSCNFKNLSSLKAIISLSHKEYHAYVFAEYSKGIESYGINLNDHSSSLIDLKKANGHFLFIFSQLAWGFISVFHSN